MSMAYAASAAEQDAERILAAVRSLRRSEPKIGALSPGRAGGGLGDALSAYSAGLHTVGDFKRGG
jgi:hypothetical protein